MVTSFIAHRGSSFLAPENTLAAFRLGWRETTMCELDARLTTEGRLVVIHDASTWRTTGANRTVGRCRLRDLQKLDAGSWKGAEWTGEKLPSVEEVLAAMPQGKRLLIEVKAGARAVPELMRVVRASGKQKRVVVHSFIYATCAAAKRALPRVPVYFLIACSENARPTIDVAVEKARRAGLEGIGVNSGPWLTAAAVRKVRAAGLKVNVWTVDEVREARRLVGLGVEGIITNRAGWLRGKM